MSNSVVWWILGALALAGVLRVEGQQLQPRPLVAQQQQQQPAMKICPSAESECYEVVVPPGTENLDSLVVNKCVASSCMSMPGWDKRLKLCLANKVKAAIPKVQQ